jgi:predicted SAM-dependent methyltransferase
MKLHLGCGSKYLSGFTHVDIEKYPHVDFVSSIDQLSFIEGSTVSEIYSSHAFEYFTRDEALDVLREWNRILIPGGKLYITVPNFEALIDIYNQTQDIQLILGPLFGKWRNSKSTIFHKTTYDHESLSKLLISSEFIEVSRFDPISYLESIDPLYDDYSLAYFPHMDRNGIQVSLAITGTKR